MDQGLQDCYCKNKERNGSQRLDQTRGSGFEGQISGSPGKLKKALEKRPCAATFGKKVPSSLCNKGASSLWKKGKKVSQESATKFGHDAAFGKKARASSVSEAFGKKVPSTASLSSLWKKGSENFASLCKKGMDLEHFF